MKSVLRQHRRWGACLVLLAYVCAATRLLPVMAAGLAAMAGDHRVVLEIGGEDTGVVLIHDRGSQGDSDRHPATPHRHGLTSRLIVAFADASEGDGHPDHVLHFKSASSTDHLNAAVAPAPTGNDLAVPVIVELRGGFAAAVVAPVFRHSLAPPGGHGVTPGVRTTVLRI